MAQPGSAPALGAGSRRFKSSRPDHKVGFRVEGLGWRDETGLQRSSFTPYTLNPIP